MARLLQLLKRHWLGLNAAALVIVAAFAYGVAVGTLGIVPYDLLEEAAAGVRDWTRYPRHNARLKPEKYLRPLAERPRELGPAQGAYEGVTLVTGLFGDSLGMRLLDMQRRVVHEWRVSFNGIWPDAPHMDDPRHDWDIQTHGVHLYSNGDIVFNFQYGGLVKIDAWRLHGERQIFYLHACIVVIKLACDCIALTLQQRR
jgi:hypothetical protein